MDEATQARFAVTPWRHHGELMQLRADLYGRGESDARARAVDKVVAWRSRKTDLPLMLDSTADIVDVILVDEKGGLEHNALRLLYATAISRFMTGLSDTQIDLTRDRPAWFPPGKSLQLPTSLLETRHCIVHRHLPSLAELKRASQAALAWLWEWYWAQLEAAFHLPAATTKSTSAPAFTSDNPNDALKNKLHALVRTYIKERKNEIKTHAPSPSTAARSFVSTYTLRFAPSRIATPSSTAAQSTLLALLITDALVLPADKKPLNMPGALAIWSPLLHALCTAVPALFPTLLSALTDAMNGPAESELRREALCLWAAHVLCDDAWASVRARRPGVGEEVLMACFSAPEYWNLQLAEKVLDEGDVPGGKTMWGAVLEAAKSEGAEMVVDGGEGVRGEQREEVGDEEEEAIGGEVKSVLVDRAAAEDKKGKTKEKVKGPVKVLGLWKPRPIGTLPEGWDEDE